MGSAIRARSSILRTARCGAGSWMYSEAPFDGSEVDRMYKWFLAWGYLNTKLIAFFGIASVMLCVAMVLVVLSVMGGFLDTIRARSRGLHSEIVLEGGSLQGFPYYEEFQKYMAEQF